MDVVKVSKNMEELITQIGQAILVIKGRAIDKATTAAEYERELAKTIIGLKNGETFSIDGEEVQNPPATVMEKIARGLRWEEKLAADTADGLYKSAIAALEGFKAQLNGYQSINRHLEDL